MKARLLYLLFIGLSALSFGQKIVAYLPDYRDASATNIDYTKLTHVIFSFVNPDASGNLIGINTPNVGNVDFDFNMNRFLMARSQCYPVKPDGPKLIISVGGADIGDDRSNRLNTVAGNVTARNNLVDQLVAFAITYDLEGIDIDWEFPTTATMRTNHEALLSRLRTQINASAKPSLRIGIAVGGETPGGHMNYINTAAFTYVDDVHLMAYDLPASFDANNHAPTATGAGSVMQNMVNNWGGVVSKSKMILGVPFYGKTPARVATGGEYRTIVTTAGQADSDGPTSGFYYNGRPTMRNKVDMIMNSTNCGQGVMIWDIGEDRTAAQGLTLLEAIHTRMTVNACPLTPNLGVDVNHCTGTTTLTVGGVAAASGRTFDWYRNGVFQSQTTANNRGITAGGKWKVIVTDGCCKETDEIIVYGGLTVGGTGATRCGTGTVNLTGTSGTTYDWYSAATGGELLGTGATFTTPSISATTTYYVQERASQPNTYYSGVAYPGASPQKEFGVMSGQAHWGNRVVVNQTMTIKTIDVYFSGTGAAVTDVRLVAYSSTDGLTPVYTSAGFTLPAQTVAPPQGSGYAFTLPVNLTLAPGTYYLGIRAPTATAGANPGITLDPTGVADFTVGSICTIGGRAFQNWGGGFTASPTPTTNYGQIFDWVIEAASNPCGRTAVQAIVNCPPVVTLTAPAPPGPVSIPGGVAYTLTATASDDGSIASVVFEIRDATTDALLATIPSTGSAGTYTASWTPTTGQSYKVRAVATDNNTASTSTGDVVVNANALPIVLLSFDATKNGSTALLSWTTASEVNSSYFVVERSTDGVTFTTIGTVAAVGNSSTLTSYYFVDNTLPSGDVYYRLTEYDIDGTSQTSVVRVINNNVATVTPNPFEKELSVKVLTTGAHTIKVQTIQGVLVWEREFKGDETTHQIGAELASGIYLITIITTEGSIVHRVEKTN